MNTAVIQLGREAWERLERVGKTSAEDWKKAAEAVSAIRNAAMKSARINKPYGRVYQAKVAEGLAQNGFGTMAKSERVACYRFAHHLPAVWKWYMAQPPEVQRRLNHPDSLFWGWRQSQGFVGRRLSAPQVNQLARSTPEVAIVPATRRQGDGELIRRVALAMSASRCAAAGSDLYGLAAAAVGALTRADLAELLGKAAEGATSARSASPSIAMHA